MTISPKPLSSTAPAATPSPSSDSDDPLLTCLLQVAALHDIACSANALVAGLPLVDQRLTPELFIRAAARAPLEAKMVEKALEEIASLVLPVVLLLDNNQAITLVEIDRAQGQLTILSGEEGVPTSVSLASIRETYSGYCIYTKAKQPFASAGSDWSAGSDLNAESHWFWGVMQSSWRIYRDVLLASFFISLFAIATPLFVMNVYDRVVPNHALETLWALALGVVVVYGFDLLLKGLRGYFIEVAGKKSDLLLSSFLFERVLGAKFSERPASIGAFVSQFREFDTLRQFYTASTITAVVDLPFVVIFLLLILYVGGALVWVPLLALPLIVGYGWLLQKPIKAAVEQTFTAAAQKNATLVESLVGLESVKALGAEGFLQRVWEGAVGHLAQWSQRLRMLSLSVVVFSGFIQQLASVILVMVGVYLIVERELTMGALIACFMLSSRALAPIAQVASLLVSYDQTKTALAALNGIVAKSQERNPAKPFVQRPSFNGGIQFNQVVFHYPDEKQPALDGLSFKIAPGEKVAIIGRVGSGKSTLQKLLLGLYSPSQGSVLFDGIDSQQIDPADLRRHIGYVPQDIVLFAGSVKANITFGSRQSDDAEMIRAAAAAGVKDFVDRHPLGFDRPVGERGQALSGGQRQSVGIARALLNQPSMYLLDEPTSGMDNSTETLIKNNLASVLEDATLILVTHKTSLLSLVDRVIVLDGGKLVADGPKDAVLDALKKGQLHVAQG